MRTAAAAGCGVPGFAPRLCPPLPAPAPRAPTCRHAEAAAAGAATGKSPLLPVRPPSFLAASLTESQGAVGRGGAGDSKPCRGRSLVTGRQGRKEGALPGT